MKVIDVLNKLAKGEKIPNFYIENIKDKVYHTNNGFLLEAGKFDLICEPTRFKINNLLLNYEIHFIENTIEILDQEEKEYLSEVIKPFRNEITYISKYCLSYGEYYILIRLNNGDSCVLPKFTNKNMYKGMKNDTDYTLEELGL